MIPVLLGLPWLASFLAGIFGSVLGFVVKYATKRFAIVAAGLVVIAGLTAGMFAAIYAIATGLSYAMPAEIVYAARLFLPSNTQACITAIASAEVLKWVYDWNIVGVKTNMYIT